MDILIVILAPLTLSIIWSVFTLSSNSVLSLVSLLLASLVLPLIFMEVLKLFWPCGLLLILMTTGLIVVFAYIVSLHSSEKSLKKSLKTGLFCLLSLTLIFVSYSPDNSPYSKILHFNPSIHTDLSTSLVLIFLLLFLVVNFIRTAYSKGGGFRKKF